MVATLRYDGGGTEETATTEDGTHARVQKEGSEAKRVPKKIKKSRH
jgi:hypothetical protein